MPATEAVSRRRNRGMTTPGRSVREARLNHRGTENTERAQGPPTRPRRNHEGTKTRRNHQARPPALSNAEARRRRAAHPTENAKTQRRKGAKSQRRGCRERPFSRFVAAEQQAIESPAAGEERGERRTRAFVVAALLTGRRARGTGVLPLALPAISRGDGPTSVLVNEDENWRGLRSPRAQAAGVWPF